MWINFGKYIIVDEIFCDLSWFVIVFNMNDFFVLKGLYKYNFFIFLLLVIVV